MADNVSVTPGTGATIAADEVVDGTLGTVKVQYVKVMDGAIDGTAKAGVGANGLKVDGSAVTQPVSGTFFQATQPVSGTFWQATQPVSGTIGVSGSVAVTGTFFQATQPVSASALPLPTGASTAAKQPALGTAGAASADVLTVQGIASGVAQPVSGTFWQTTQPVSIASMPSTPVTGTFWQATQPVSGTVTANAGTNLNTSALALDATITGGTQRTKVTDGTNNAAVKAASTAAVATDPSLVVSVSPNNTIAATQSGTWNIGTITTLPAVVQGAAGTAAGAWFSKNTDGTNVAAVKAASTAVATTDPALVVALSQNGYITTIARLLSAAATTNSTLVKGSAGRVFKIRGYNAKAAVAYLKLYNKATAPTVGTDTPVVTIPLKASDMFDIDFAGLGLGFATGIGFGLTGAVADADTTALVAADVVGLNVFYA
jgi:hypothetical protein